MRILSRRECLRTLGGAAVVARVPRFRPASVGAKVMRGVFIILNTPFASDGAVDWDDLAHEVAFVDRGGCQGVVWPQGSSGVATLTRDERVRGMERTRKDCSRQAARARAWRAGQGHRRNAGVPHRSAETLGADAMIAMPPTTSHVPWTTTVRISARWHASQRDRQLYRRAVAPAGLVPSTNLIVELAREFPHCGYVKEESQPLIPRMKAELQARPAMRGVFGASFADGWLYEMRRLGLDGVMTGEGMYADLIGRDLGRARTWSARRGARCIQRVSAHAQPRGADSWHRPLRDETARRVQDDRSPREPTDVHVTCSADGVQTHFRRTRGNRVPLRSSQAVSDALAGERQVYTVGTRRRRKKKSSSKKASPRTRPSKGASKNPVVAQRKSKPQTARTSSRFTRLSGGGIVPLRPLAKPIPVAKKVRTAGGAATSPSLEVYRGRRHERTFTPTQITARFSTPRGCASSSGAKSGLLARLP